MLSYYKRSFFIFFIFFICSTLFLCISCGKVTQVIESPKSESTVFQLNYIMPASVSENKTVSFHVSKPIYTSVLSYDTKSKPWKLLSWGKATVSLEAKPSIERIITSNLGVKNQPLFLSSSYDKKNNIVKSAGNGITFCTFKNEDTAWLFESPLLKKGFPFYLVAIFNHPSDFRLKLVDAKDPLYSSFNATVTIASISPYDTGIALIALQILFQNSQLSLSALSEFYSEDFFKEINYHFSKIPEKTFKLEMPHFILPENSLEYFLAKIYQTKISSNSDAISYLQKNKEHFSNKIYATLFKMLNSEN